MKVTELTLDNFQSYTHEALEFEEGVSLLHGDNGAGKSTILRAIFAGLFQTEMGRHAASDFDSIGELVKNGEEEGGVILTFEADGAEYTLTWTISVDDPDEEEPTGKTKDCVLEGPGNVFPVDGVKAVRSAIHEIIGMDARAFTNSVYVQQDEVMRLITADDGERREIFDDLLGLSRLDNYIDRTVELRREAKSKRDEAANRRDELQNQLEDEYPDRDELAAKQQSLGRDLLDAEQERDRLQEQVNDLKSERDDLQERIQNYGDLETERDDLTTEIENLTQRIKGAEERIEELDETKAAHKQEMWETRRQINELDEAIDGFDVTDADAAEDAVNTANETYVTATNDKTKAEQSVTSLEDKHDDAQVELNALRDDLEQAEKEVVVREQEVADAEQEIEAAREAVTEAVEARHSAVSEVIPDGLVPDDISQDTELVLVEYRDELVQERDTAQTKITRLETQLDSKKETVSRLEDEIQSVKDERQETLEALPDDVQNADKGGDQSLVADRLDDARAVAEKMGVSTPKIAAENLGTLLNGWMPEVQDELREMHADTIEEYVSVKSEKLALESKVDDLRHILEEGSCPLCGEKVADDNAHHEEERSRLKEQFDAIEESLVKVQANRDEIEYERELLDQLRDILSEMNLARALAEYDEKLDALWGELNQESREITEIKQEISDLQDEVGDLTESIQAIEETGLPAFHSVEDAKQQVTDAESNAELIRKELATAEAERDSLKTDVAEKESEIESLGADIESAKADLEDAKDAVDTAKSVLTQVKDAVELHDEFAEHERAINDAESEQESKQDVIDTLIDQRGEKQARLESVTEELSRADISDLRTDLNATEQSLTDAQDDLQDAQERVDDLNGDIARVENKLEAYDNLASRISDLDSQMNWAQNIVEEMNALIDTYAGVKARLRKENIQLINAYANDVFRELYHSSSYERIILNDDYTISLLKSDGSRISPKLSSGGESAIVNIALRAGVYRTIAERNQTNSGGLPPFILDEPTTFLDSGHVRELESVIKSIKSWDVSQVIIVSHDESLIDSADYEYEVTKDPATDTSSCTRRQASTGGI